MAEPFRPRRRLIGNGDRPAREPINRAIALDPKNARAFRERSNSFHTIGRLDRALADANETVRLDPDDAKAFDNRGNVFNNNRQYDRANADPNTLCAAKILTTVLSRGVADHCKSMTVLCCAAS